MAFRLSPSMLDFMRDTAPGTPLRDGLDRILQSRKGALIVLDDSPHTLAVCSGGFDLDAHFTPQRLAELSKMDGAIILDRRVRRIAKANVHLMPDPSVETDETGTRHRTAERVARSLEVPVLSVSEDRSVITAYLGADRHQLETPARLVVRADQALQTLQRYRARLDEVMANFSLLEVEDVVTLRDLAVVLQRLELVTRIANEIAADIIELGSDGRLVELQRRELMSGVDDDRHLLIRDYFHEDTSWHVQESLDALAGLEDAQLLDSMTVAGILHLPTHAIDLDAPMTPRGFRLLGKVPRLPTSVIGHVVDHFGDLPRIIRATHGELEEVEGVGATRARLVKDSLARLTESSILESYR